MLIHLRSVVPTPRTGSSRHSRMNLTMALPNATSLRKGRQIQQLTVGGSENPLGAGSSRRGTSRRCASCPFFQLPRSFFLTVIGNSCVAMTRASKGAVNLLPFKHTVRGFVGRCRHHFQHSDQVCSSGWSDYRLGLAPAGKHRISHGAHPNGHRLRIRGVLCWWDSFPFLVPHRATAWIEQSPKTRPRTWRWRFRYLERILRFTRWWCGCSLSQPD
jgi:hypothetical protein